MTVVGVRVANHDDGTSGDDGLPGRESSNMWSTIVDRNIVQSDLDVARRRAWALTPFSPAWDAAMAIVEDLERALWLLEFPRHLASDQRQDESRVAATTA